LKFINENWKRLILLAYILITPVVSFALDVTGSTTSTSTGTTMLTNPLGNTTTLPALIKTILTGVLTIGIPIAALAIIYCGFLFVFARGNSEKLSKAKDALLYTIIGAAILLGAWAIATMISSTITAL